MKRRHEAEVTMSVSIERTVHQKANQHEAEERQKIFGDISFNAKSLQVRKQRNHPCVSAEGFSSENLNLKANRVKRARRYQYLCEYLIIKALYANDK